LVPLAAYPAGVATGVDFQEDRLALAGSSREACHSPKEEAGGDEDPEFVVDPVKLLVALRLGVFHL